jgi:hypothetical protein
MPANYIRKTKNYAPIGMFEISKPMLLAEDLKVWEDHFAGKGIKTVIVTDDSGKFILCREGIEAIG